MNYEEFKGHTPGPWEFTHDEKHNMISVHIPNFDINDDSEDYTICGIWAVGHYEGKKFPNAKLIAAAPELLKQVEELTKVNEELKAVMDELVKSLDRSNSHMIELAGGVFGKDAILAAKALLEKHSKK